MIGGIRQWVDAKGFHVGDLSRSEYESETGSKFATNEFNNYDDKPYILEASTSKGSPFKAPTVPIESLSSAVNAVYHDSKIKEALAKAESLGNQGYDNYDFGKA